MYFTTVIVILTSRFETTDSEQLFSARNRGACAHPGSTECSSTCTICANLSNPSFSGLEYKYTILVQLTIAENKLYTSVCHTCQRHNSLPSASRPSAAKSLPPPPALLPAPLQSPLVKPASIIVVDSLSSPCVSTLEAVATAASWNESSSAVPAWKVFFYVRVSGHVGWLHIGRDNEQDGQKTNRRTKAQAQKRTRLVRSFSRLPGRMVDPY